jgi:hypothetical protein
MVIVIADFRMFFRYYGLKVYKNARKEIWKIESETF